ncbi:hypothetical protein [Hydrogenophaga sp.]|nr:hypothetical protein [Hydrogenophaga sp.]
MPGGRQFDDGLATVPEGHTDCFIGLGAGVVRTAVGDGRDHAGGHRY